MGNISQKQQHLREEIKGLEKRLAGLEGHRQEYKRQVEDAEDRKREELDQLAMVRTMLRDKQRNRERVSFRADNKSDVYVISWQLHLGIFWAPFYKELTSITTGPCLPFLPLPLVPSPSRNYTPPPPINLLEKVS